MIKNVMYPLLERVIPRTIREEYEKTGNRFKNLFLHFFEWLETEHNFIRVLLDFQEAQDISKEIEPYIDWYLSELGWNYTKPIHIKKKDLILALKDFYLSKGSEDSFKFLFKVLYNQDCKISYPRDNLFTLSNAEYVNDNVILVSANNINTTSYRAIFDNSLPLSITITGLKSKAKAIVNSKQEWFNNNTFYLWFNLDLLEGLDFIPNETIKITNTINNISILETTIDILNIDIIDKGQYYQPEDIINITEYDFKGLIKVKSITSGYITKINIIDAGIDYRVGDAIIANSKEGNGFFANISEVDINGAITKIRIYNKGRGYKSKPNLIIKTKFGKNAVLTLDSVDIGGIKDFKWINYYFKSNTNTNVISIESDIGQDAILELNKSGCIGNKNYSFRNQKGFLNTNNSIIQDSYFFQHYSYALESVIPSFDYKKIVDELLHPVGYVRYNKLRIVNVLKEEHGLDDIENTFTIIKRYESNTQPDIEYRGNNYFYIDIQSNIQGYNSVLYHNNELFDIVKSSNLFEWNIENVNYSINDVYDNKVVVLETLSGNIVEEII